MTHPIISRPLQSRFLDIPRAPVAYWLTSRFFELLHNTLPVLTWSYVRQGICTTNNARFLRCMWEVSCIRRDGRWVLFAKGGGTQRWSGLDQYAVDWDNDGIRVKSFQEDTPGAIHWSGRMPDKSYFF